MDTYFCPSPRGLEEALAEELKLFGAQQVAAVHGGVCCEAPREFMYVANLQSRLASRVLRKLSDTRYRNERDIYGAALAIDWHALFSVDATIKVNVTARRCPLKSVDFVALKIKDAICDQFRNACGDRPDVDTATPDIRIHAYIDADQLVLYLDTSGEALFKRGYRGETGDAPLRENLAAGLLRLAGWTPEMPLLDPMCGSGTILAEAAQIALDIAPGLKRSFAFEKFLDFDAEVWERLRGDAEKRIKLAAKLDIFGSDVDPRAIAATQATLEAAGVAHVVRLKQANILDIAPPCGAGIIVTNPPYGVRIGEDKKLAELYPKLAAVLKQKFAGWQVNFLTSDMRMPKLMRLSPSRKIPLFNGAIECRLFQFKMVEGSMRK